jgi:hypothetical protein
MPCICWDIKELSFHIFLSLSLSSLCAEEERRADMARKRNKTEIPIPKYLLSMQRRRSSSSSRKRERERNDRKNVYVHKFL